MSAYAQAEPSLLTVSNNFRFDSLLSTHPHPCPFVRSLWKFFHAPTISSTASLITTFYPICAFPHLPFLLRESLAIHRLMQPTIADHFPPVFGHQNYHLATIKLQRIIANVAFIRAFYFPPKLLHSCFSLELLLVES